MIKFSRLEGASAMDFLAGLKDINYRVKASAGDNKIWASGGDDRISAGEGFDRDRASGGKVGMPS